MFANPILFYWQPPAYPISAVVCCEPFCGEPPWSEAGHCAPGGKKICQISWRTRAYGVAMSSSEDPPTKRARTRNESKHSTAPPKTSGKSSATGATGATPPPTMPPPFIMKILKAPPCGGGGGDFRGDFTNDERTYIDKNLTRREAKRLNNVLRTIKPEKVPRRIRVLRSQLPDPIKAEMFQQLGEHDTAKYTDWVERALRLPVGVYTQPPTPDERIQFLQDARRKMDDEIVGQNGAKQEVLRLICSWLNDGGAGFAIGLEGEAGVGKTTFVKRALAAAMNRPFCFIGLGGASDASGLLGHSYTYEGAVPGRLSECVTQSGVMDPVIFFDELDKVSATGKGDEMYNTLIHLCDPVQNGHFRDRYLHGIDMDFSRAIFVFSYNDPSRINPVLLDRIKRIRVDPPSHTQRLDICTKHLIPRSLSEFKLSVACAPDVVSLLLLRNAGEPGMRGIEKDIAHMVASFALVQMYGTIDVLGLEQGLCKGDCLDLSFARLVLPEKSSVSKMPPSMMYM